eukprot:EG_transcript_13888
MAAPGPGPAERGVSPPRPECCPAASTTPRHRGSANTRHLSEDRGSGPVRSIHTRRQPLGCDTFVSCFHGTTVFGKNSDRPHDEVQNVVYVPGANHPEGATVQCTYISIPQAPETHDVVLCQPYWMWGAEMGANSRGVVVGNEAVWGRIASSSERRLLGMDFVRLMLERSSTAAEAVDVFVDLLARHGQGGPCDVNSESFTYHNSYLIADANEAWVVESMDRWWVAKRFVNRTRNISNDLSIRASYDRVHPELLAFCQAEGWWDGERPFNWKAVMSNGQEADDSDQEVDLGCCGEDRELKGKAMLRHFSRRDTTQIDVQDMLAILRDRDSGISMEGSFRTTASMVARLTGTSTQCWFTATPLPHAAVFKPFAFPSPARRAEVAGSGVWTAVAATKRRDPKTLWWLHEASTKARRQALKELEEEVFD